MSSRQAMVIPLNLGPAEKYDRSAFPLSSFRNLDPLERGNVLLDATIEELLQIIQMINALKQDGNFVNTTKFRYDELVDERQKLESRTKTLNPFRAFKNYRAVTIFYNATKALYRETRTTSEQLRRTLNRKMVSIAREEIQAVGDDLPAGATVTGIALKGDNPMDEATERKLSDLVSALTPNADLLAGNALVDQLNSLAENVVQHVASQTPQTSQTAPAPQTTQASQISPSQTTPSPSTTSENRLSALSTTSSPTSPSSAASVNNNFFLSGCVISPHASFNGSSLSQGNSQNSGPVNNNLPQPAPSETS